MVRGGKRLIGEEREEKSNMQRLQQVYGLIGTMQWRPRYRGPRASKWLLRIVLSGTHRFSFSDNVFPNTTLQGQYYCLALPPRSLRVQRLTFSCLLTISKLQWGGRAEGIENVVMAYRIHCPVCAPPRRSHRTAACPDSLRIVYTMPVPECERGLLSLLVFFFPLLIEAMLSFFRCRGVGICGVGGGYLACMASWG